MKTIEVPNLIIKVNDVDVDFTWYINTILNSDRRFNESGVAIRASIKVENALKNIADGKLILEDSDWNILKVCVEEPSGGQYPLSPARTLLPFIDAVSNAK